MATEGSFKRNPKLIKINVSHFGSKRLAIVPFQRHFTGVKERKEGRREGINERKTEQGWVWAAPLWHNVPMSSTPKQPEGHYTG